MSEMIERVAKAIAETVRNDGMVTYDSARAAIEAMRDPTDEMASAFAASCDEHGMVMWKSGYRAMIDEALK